MLKSLLLRYHNLNWAIADQLLVSGVNFLTSICIARVLGLEAFGQFTIIWLIVQFFSSIQESLLLSPMISIGAKLKQKTASNYFIGIYSLALIYASIASLLVLLLAFTLNQYVNEVNMPSALYLFIITFLFLLRETLRRILFSCSKLKLVFISDAISYLGQLSLLILLLIFSNVELTTVFWLIGFSSLLAVIFSYFVIPNLRFSLLKLLFAWRRNWPIAKWMVSSSILNWLTGNLFIISAGVYLGNSAVGALKAAQNIVGINHVLFKLIENIAPVKAGKLLVESGTNKMVTYLKQVTVISVVIYLFFVLIILAFSQQLMTFIYGAEYTQYSWLLIVWFTFLFY